MSDNEIGSDSPDEFQRFLETLLGGSSSADAEVEARFEELAPTVNATLAYLSGRIDNGDEGDYTFTLTVEETRWVLSAIGNFVAVEVRTEPEIALPLFAATEKMLDVTAVSV